MEKKIGQLIKEEVERQGLTPNQFAGLICTSRQNLYHIYKCDNIDMDRLIRISYVLHRNFFTELYKDMASMLGAAEPPATWANMKLQSLTHPLREELGMKVEILADIFHFSVNGGNMGPSTIIDAILRM